MNMFGITEITPSHTNRTPGFHVRLGWHEGKPAISKEFHLASYLSKEAILQAAIAYRNIEFESLKRSGNWPIDRHRDMDNLIIRNTSGINGVHRARQHGNLPGGQRGKLNCFAWIASWQIDKKLKTASFAELKWGAETAKQMACNCREARRNIYI